MESVSFEFRICQNPDCGLRYPLIERSPYGERCPICLGETIAVAHTKLEREPDYRDEAAMAPTGPQALLDNVRSAWNTGSILRSAEGFGFSHVYLCGITPTPENDQVRKTALSAEARVGWSAHPNAVALLATMKGRGHAVWALEQTPQSRSVDAVLHGQSPDGNLILVVGNEQAGVDPGILQIADKVIHIEMRGNKRSFNVAVAFAVAAHALTRPQIHS